MVAHNKTTGEKEGGQGEEKTKQGNVQNLNRIGKNQNEKKLKIHIYKYIYVMHLCSLCNECLKIQEHTKIQLYGTFN